jgi:hypothetical protein
MRFGYGSIGGAALAFALGIFAAGCVEEVPAQIALSPQGEQIEITNEKLPNEQYKELGDVVGEGIGGDPREASLNADNDLRNHTASLGASFVTVDSRQTESYGYFTGKVKLQVHGIAYRLRD